MSELMNFMAWHKDDLLTGLIAEASSGGNGDNSRDWKVSCPTCKLDKYFPEKTLADQFLSAHRALLGHTDIVLGQAPVENFKVVEKDEDNFKVVAKAIVDRSLAQEIASKLKGIVVQDTEDPKEFMVLVKEQRGCVLEVTKLKCFHGLLNEHDLILFTQAMSDDDLLREYYEMVMLSKEPGYGKYEQEFMDAVKAEMTRRKFHREMSAIDSDVDKFEGQMESIQQLREKFSLGTACVLDTFRPVVVVDLSNAEKHVYSVLRSVLEEHKVLVRQVPYHTQFIAIGVGSDQVKHLRFSPEYEVDIGTLGESLLVSVPKIDQQYESLMVKFGLAKEIQEKIVKVGSKWRVEAESGRDMGTYDTKEEAEVRLKQIEMFKAMRKN